MQSEKRGFLMVFLLVFGWYFRKNLSMCDLNVRINLFQLNSVEIAVETLYVDHNIQIKLIKHSTKRDCEKINQKIFVIYINKTKKNLTK